MGSSGNNYGVGALEFNASLSNSIYGNSTTVQPQSALLIPYVKAFAGASVDSTDLAITEVANDVVRISGRVYLVESAVNDDGSWYRKYSDGWLEQGGKVNAVSETLVITLLKPYRDTNYSVMRTLGNSEITGHTYSGALSPYYFSVRALTKTTFKLSCYDTDDTKVSAWRAEGMGAE